MIYSHAMLFAAVISLPCLSSRAQAPVVAAPAQVAAPVGLSTSSKILQPALDTVQQTASALRLDKWKKGSVRDEAADNIAAIARDIKTNLPPLLATADAAPQMPSKALPVLRNVDALYDVLLRVNEAARVSAPADQVSDIDQALNSLQKARLALDDNLQDATALMETKVGELQKTVDAQASVKCPVVATPAAPQCTPPPARKARKKPAAPATTPATPAPAAAASKSQN